MKQLEELTERAASRMNAGKSCCGTTADFENSRRGCRAEKQEAIKFGE